MSHARTANEVEGKILEIDPSVEILKLQSLGFERVFSGELVAMFFKNGRGDVLRLRSEQSGWVLNHKGGPTAEETAQVKSRPETETVVESPENLEAILLAVGFEKLRTVRKTRTTFVRTQDGVKTGHVEIDEYPGIPPLLEIESDSREKVLAIAQTLGYAPGNVVSDTIRDLEKRYGFQFGDKA